MKKRLEVLVILGWAVVLSALLSTPALGITTRGMSITRVKISERLDLEGNLWVTKEYQVNFSTPHHGIYRYVPKGFIDPVTRKRRAVKIDKLNIYNCLPGGSPHRYTVRNEDGILFVKIGDPHHTVKGNLCYGISYRVTGAVLRVSKEVQGLFWNLVGTGWNLPLHDVHAELHLPDEVRITGTRCYHGHYHSTESCTSLTRQGNTLVMEEPVLMDHQALTLGVNWTPPMVKETVIHDTLFEKKRRLFNIFVMAWIAAVLLIGYLWYTSSTLSLGKAKAVFYHPPEEIGILEAGVLIDNGLDGRDITAAFISLAHKGYIRIEQTKDKKSLFSSSDYRLTLKKDPDEDLDPYEAIIISTVFGVNLGEHVERQVEETGHSGMKEAWQALMRSLGSGDATGPRSSITVKEMVMLHLGSSLYKHLSKVIYRNLQQKGYFSLMFTPVRVFASFLGFLIFLPLNFGLMITSRAVLPRQLPMVEIPPQPLLLLFNALVGVQAMRLSTKRIGAKTKKGKETTWRLAGLKEFIATVEADRLRRMYGDDELPGVFERFLPYAVIFGEEKRWGKVFDPILQATGYSPSWYHGTGGFRAAEFSHGISSSISSAASGGGSGAGGGGGGGGGGGW